MKLTFENIEEQFLNLKTRVEELETKLNCIPNDHIINLGLSPKLCKKLTIMNITTLSDIVSHSAKYYIVKLGKKDLLEIESIVFDSGLCFR